MNPAGSIHIGLYHRAGQASAVHIASSRPEAATQVLLGKTPEQLLDMVPLLFTLCGNAQSYAALLACRTALGKAGEPAPDTARVMLVQLETLREHAWRILLDWPAFTGLAPDKKALAALLKFDAQFKRHLFQGGEAFKSGSRLDVDAVQLTRLIDELAALVDAAIFNGQMASYQMLSTEAQLRGWSRRSGSLPAGLLDYLYSRGWMAVGQNNVACLPELEADALDWQMQRDGLAAFVRTPHWQNCCFETTPLNRQLAQPLVTALQGRYGNGLVVRIVARLLEVAGIPGQLKQRLAQLKGHMPTPATSTTHDGMALAQVQAARGLLIHRLVLRQGRVYDYRIVAPTEWNFHPDGVVVQGLRHLHAQNPGDLEQQAQLLVNAVDPCVQYTLNLMDSNNETKAQA